MKYEDWLKERDERSKKLHAELERSDLTREELVRCKDELEQIEEKHDLMETRRKAESLSAATSVALETSKEVVERDKTLAPKVDHDKALRAWADDRDPAPSGSFEIDLTKAERHLKMIADGWTAKDIVERAQTTADGKGGEAISTTLETTAYMALLAIPGVMQAGATMLNTGSGNTHQIPIFTPPADHGTELNELDDVVVHDVGSSKIELNAYAYASAKTVSRELAQDIEVDIQSIIGRSFGHEMARILNNKFTKGDGTNKPKGITDGLTKTSTNATQAAATNAIVHQDLINLFASLPVGYIDSTAPGDTSWGMPRSGGLRFMMHPLTWAYLMGLEDNDGRPLFGPYGSERMGRQLLGIPIVFNEQYPTARTTGTLQMSLGNFADHYIIRRAGGMRFSWSPHSMFIKRAVQYMVEMRVDGQIQDTKAIRHLFLK